LWVQASLGRANILVMLFAMALVHKSTLLTEMWWSIILQMAFL
jgi:hypothetical protein